jgi:hypothetical protein
LAGSMRIVGGFVGSRPKTGANLWKNLNYRG